MCGRLLTFILIPLLPLLTVSRRAASLVLSIETYRWMLSQKEPIPTVFREHRELELSDLSSDLRSGSRAALIASGKFGPRDVASRFLLSSPRLLLLAGES